MPWRSYLARLRVAPPVYLHSLGKKKERTSPATPSLLSAQRTEDYLEDVQSVICHAFDANAEVTVQARPAIISLTPVQRLKYPVGRLLTLYKKEKDNASHQSISMCIFLHYLRSFDILLI